MQGNATPFDGRLAAKREKPVVSKQSHVATPYQKVMDGRKRPIRGLWIRGSPNAHTLGQSIRHRPYAEFTTLLQVCLSTRPNRPKIFRPNRLIESQ